MKLGKISITDLRLILELLPLLAKDEAEVSALIREKPDKIFSPDNVKVYWCQFYEMPFLEHLGRVIGGMGLVDMVTEVSKSPSPIEVLKSSVDEFSQELDTAVSSEEEEAQNRKAAPFILSFAMSAIASLKCLMVYGCYLNDLIARVREHGDEKALFNAVRIDPTVLGCPSVLALLSKAVVLDDKSFFKKLQNALSGRFQKRDQANFKKMRLVLQVLKESGADRLDDDDLHELFVKKLNLYTANISEGGSQKSLRKFVDQYSEKTQPLKK